MVKNQVVFQTQLFWNVSTCIYLIIQSMFIWVEVGVKDTADKHYAYIYSGSKSILMLGHFRKI